MPRNHRGCIGAATFVGLLVGTACGGGGSGGDEPPPSVVLRSIAVSPPSKNVSVGGGQQFTATGTFSDGLVKDVTTTVAWTSSDGTRATVDAAGLATAATRAAGLTTIRASSGGVSGSAVLRIVITLPRTGQTASTSPGDDGALQKGVAWPTPRLIDNADGTVTDALTGLMWLKDANCIATSYPAFDTDGTAGDGAVTWQHAMDFVEGINTGAHPSCGGGHADWRLPNGNELESLLDSSAVGPALPAGHPFTNVQPSSYWTSTTSANDSANAWLVQMSYGWTSSPAKTNPIYVWPVRDAATAGTIALPRTGQAATYAAGDDGALQEGVALPPQRFADNLDGTVTDNLTGLVWLGDANCIATAYPSFDTDGTAGDGAVTWQRAFDFVAGINAGTYPSCGAGHADWRLPNRNELRSVIDRSMVYPALPSGPPLTHLQQYDYWSSTRYAGDAVHAWAVGMMMGSQNEDHVASVGGYYVWAVRNGP